MWQLILILGHKKNIMQARKYTQNKNKANDNTYPHKKQERQKKSKYREDVIREERLKNYFHSLTNKGTDVKI